MDTTTLTQTVGWLALVLGGLFVIGLCIGAWLIGRRTQKRDTEKEEHTPLLGVVHPPCK